MSTELKMKKLLFVTSNSGKLLEVQSILQPLGFAVDSINLELTEIQGDQAQVAKHKALEARKTVSDSLVVEDTGWYFEAYGNFPGILARQMAQSIGIDGLLKLLEEKSHSAYVLTIAAFLPAGETEPLLFTGKCSGQITQNKTEAHPRLPYDSIFIPNGGNCTFGQMTQEEINKYSARRKAFEELANYLIKHKKE